MIVDTSALVAVVNSEPEAVRFLGILMREQKVRLSAVTYFEFGMVVDNWQDEATSLKVDRLLSGIEAEIVAVDPDTARIARAAYRRFGKKNHPAKLNFGDCFAYALAKQTGEPLLFKGDDFAQTDIVSAV